ncbi:hypothetical protein M569_15575 [Genlisea aurea]|uniref:Uncharacterized protein n=1 Tax=Genlisea aurea TaxID=192259 RepID=S8BXV1_9LAMI|nr:hypothetical protein M569_15575 [Genlisea aurea]
MKGLQMYIQRLFRPDLLPGVDDCHQLQRCFVHATRHDYYDTDAARGDQGLPEIRPPKHAPCGAYRGRHGVSQVHSFWSSCFTREGGPLKPLVPFAEQRSGEVWDLVRSMWSTSKFLQEAGFFYFFPFDIRRIVFSPHYANERSLGARPIDGAMYAHFASHTQPKGKGFVVFQGVDVRKVFLEQIADRFLSRSALDLFGWLDLNTWPSVAVPSFASDCLLPVYKHWEGRLQRWSLTFEDLRDELRAAVNVGLALVRPVDSLVFWRAIICGQGRQATFVANLGSFVDWIMRPSAFSKLQQILTDHRMLLDIGLIEQLLVLKLDAPPWEEYPFAPLLARFLKQAPRTRFRLARADKGTKRPITQGFASRGTWFTSCLVGRACDPTLPFSFCLRFVPWRL